MIQKRTLAASLAVVLPSTLGGCGGETKTVTERVTVTVQAPEPTPTPDVGEPSLDDAPKRPGEILIEVETNPQIVGPYDFQPGGYTFRFEQYDPLGEVTDWAQTSSLVVSLESKPNDVVDPYQLLVNDEAQKGASQVTSAAGYS
jgi:hypothetical protein